MNINNLKILFIDTPAGRSVPTVEIWKDEKSTARSVGTRNSPQWRVVETKGVDVGRLYGEVTVRPDGAIEPGPIKETPKVERTYGYTWGGRRPEQQPCREGHSEPVSRLATAVALLITAATMLVGWFWLK
jgi:hypothetical protein